MNLFFVKAMTIAYSTNIYFYGVRRRGWGEEGIKVNWLTAKFKGGNLPLDESQIIIATYSTNSLNYFEVSSAEWLFHRYCKLPQYW